MKVTTEVKKAGPIGHWIGKKWGVTGQVGFEPDLSKAHIKVDYSTKAIVKNTGKASAVVDLAVKHEQGHADYFIETIAMEGMEFAQDIAINPKDIWSNEVDAWIRALGEAPPINYTQGKFILDCLATYAKAYATDEEFQAAKDVVADFARTHYQQPIRDYEPEVPEDEPPPPSPFAQEGAGEGQDSDDRSEGGQDEGEGDPQPQGGVDGGQDPYWDEDEDAPKGDDPREERYGGSWHRDPNADRWTELSKPEYVLAATTGGKDALVDMMKANGVKPATLTNLPPILAAIVGQG